MIYDPPDPQNRLYKQETTPAPPRAHTHTHTLLACSDPLAKQVYYDLQELDRR